MCKPRKSRWLKSGLKIRSEDLDSLEFEDDRSKAIDAGVDGYPLLFVVW